MMSENEHAAAIREYATELREGGYTAGILSQTAVALRVDHIIRRTDALAAQLAEAEARCKRLQAFVEETAWYVAQEDWEDAARRLLRYGDARRFVEIVPEHGDFDPPGDTEPTT